MKERYRLFRRRKRIYYAFANTTSKKHLHRQPGDHWRGAIYNFGTSLTLNQSTVVGNSSTGGGSQGGGTGNGGGPFYLTTTIVCSNTASTSSNIVGTVIPLSSTNNLVDFNAMLYSLGNYGGPTQTMLPPGGSPVIDARSDSMTNFLSTEQRLLPRLFGAHVIGAVFDTPAGSGQFQFTDTQAMN